MKGLLFLFFFSFVLFSAFSETKRPLALDDIFHPEKKLDFQGSVPHGIVWLKDSQSYLQFSGESMVWLKIDSITGNGLPFYNKEKIEKALSAFFPDKAKQIVEQGESFIWNSQYNGFIVEQEENLYYYSMIADKAIQVTKSKDKKDEVAFSPDGKHISFVIDNNLYIVSLDTLEQKQITQDGNEKIYNGILDWVYQEEIFGRGNFRGYWWSKDSQKIAFLRLDASQVKTFVLPDDSSYEQKREVLSYPKAGTPNPKVSLGIFHLETKKTVWADLLDKEKDQEILLVDVCWKPEGKTLLIQIQNRIQTWLDYILVDISTGKTETLFRETTQAWVNYNGSPFYLLDGSFFYLSEKNGWKHIYQYLPQEKKTISVTSGLWEVRDFYGVEESSQKLYFSSTKEHATEEHIYVCSWNTKEIKQLSNTPGTHSARFSPDFKMFLDYASNISSPQNVNLYDQNGKKIRNVYENKPKGLQICNIKPPRILQIPARDRFLMEAMIFYPISFNPKKKYPVLVHVYGGPQTPQVKNRWGRNGYMWHHFLSQQGYIVFVLDNRLASGKGAVSAWKSYKNFGKQELEDLEDGIEWLKTLHYVNAKRIGLWGWSFGGYMTCYALTNSKTFKSGIAVAPVTDWRNYDTIYTERYMDTPQNNPAGYEKSSVLFNARNLTARLLLVHGLADDNVHFQNSAQFIYALQEAGKNFQIMVYPKARHGIENPYQTYHLFSIMHNFLQRNL